MKKLLLFFIMLGMSFSFVSCDKGDDSDDDNGYSSKIIGTWVMYKSYEDGEWWYWDEDEGEYYIVRFYKGGSGYTIEYDENYPDDVEEYPFYWEIDGNIITTNISEDEGIYAKILSLDDEELVIEYTDYGQTYREYYIKIED